MKDFDTVGDHLFLYLYVSDVVGGNRADCKANSDQVGDVYFPKSLNQIDDLDIHLTKRMTNIRENRIPHLARL